MSLLKKYVMLSCVLTFSILVKAETYVVSVGIAKYKNIPSLTLPENDAKTIASIYKRRTKKVITMTGRYATRNNIIKVLSAQFKRAKKGDMILFFFSGHGYEGWFCPYDMDNNGRNALSYNDIYKVFKQSGATRKIIMADACMSGGLRQKQSGNHHFYHKKSDVVLFLSSRTKEFSMESKKMRNGYFTTYLAKGLRGTADFDRNRKVTAKEIYTYVSKKVKTVCNNKQHPVMWGNFRDNLVMIDWKH